MPIGSMDASSELMRSWRGEFQGARAENSTQPNARSALLSLIPAFLNSNIVNRREVSK